MNLKQRIATRFLQAEGHDCRKDYQAGGLTWAQYQRCLQQAGDDTIGGHGAHPGHEVYPINSVKPLSHQEVEHFQTQIERTLIAISMTKGHNPKEAAFLGGLIHRTVVPKNEAQERDTILQKYSNLTRSMPKDLEIAMQLDLSTYRPKVFGNLRNPQHVAFVNRFWSEYKEYMGSFMPITLREHPLPEHYQDKPVVHFMAQQGAQRMQVLDELLQRRADPFIKSIRDQVERGKILTENQLRAMRAVLYRNGMREEADLFR